MGISLYSQCGQSGFSPCPLLPGRGGPRTLQGDDQPLCVSRFLAKPGDLRRQGDEGGRRLPARRRTSRRAGGTGSSTVNPARICSVAAGHDPCYRHLLHAPGSRLAAAGRIRVPSPGRGENQAYRRLRTGNVVGIEVHGVSANSHDRKVVPPDQVRLGPRLPCLLRRASSLAVPAIIVPSTRASIAS